MRMPLVPVVVAFAWTAGCRQDMQVQPKYMPLGASDFFADGRASRPVPAHVVATDEAGVDDVVQTGLKDGEFATALPVPVSVDFLKRGHERYDIYCSPCHGRTGDGRGMVALRGFKIPADLSSARVRNAPPGYLFAVISDGYGAMPDYSYQVGVPDRWAIVAYIRALELSRQTSINDATPEARSRLEAQP